MTRYSVELDLEDWAMIRALIEKARDDTQSKDEHDRLGALLLYFNSACIDGIDKFAGSDDSAVDASRWLDPDLALNKVTREYIIRTNAHPSSNSFVEVVTKTLNEISGEVLPNRFVDWAEAQRQKKP